MKLSFRDNKELLGIIFAVLAIIVTAIFAYGLGIMEFYIDITPVIMLRFIACIYLMIKVHDFSKQCINRKYNVFVIILQVLLFYLGTFDIDRIVDNVKFPSATNACLAASKCDNNHSLYYSASEPDFAIFKSFEKKLYFYKNDNGYQCQNFLWLEAIYTYQDENATVEIYHLPDNYFIYVEVSEDEISKVVDNTEETFKSFSSITNKNYYVKNYYGKVIDKIEGYSLTIDGKKIDITF